MVRCATFEVCGLYFILQRAEKSAAQGVTFKLRDEAFADLSATFTAKNYIDLFLLIENCIGIKIPEETQLSLRSSLGPLSEKPDREQPCARASGRILPKPTDLTTPLAERLQVFSLRQISRSL